MSVVKDLITNFLEEMAEFAEPREDRRRKGRRKPVPVRIRTREDAEAVRQWENEGGRLRRRRPRSGLFDD